MDMSCIATPLGGLILATLAGVSIPLGAVLARLDYVLPRWLETELRHTIVAFGGGALFSAIALVLLPEAIDRLPALPVLGWFAAGGLAFFAVDRALARHGGHGAQFMAMMLDYLPEAMALGALVTGRPEVALLTAGLIALQNLPEGFGAWREMTQGGGPSPRRLMILFLLMAPLGPAAAALGIYVLADMPMTLGAIMAFASGGILYLLFEDIAPAARLENAHAPALGAVAGFGLGLAGHLATLP